jgi:hypothetical protein
LPVEVFKKLRAFFLIEMDQNLRIRVGVKPMATSLQVLPKLWIVEDLPIVNDPDGPIFIVNRLVSTAQVDDAQPGMGKSGVLTKIDPKGIRAPMPEQSQHLPEKLLRRRGRVEVNDAGYATHKKCLKCLK